MSLLQPAAGEVFTIRTYKNFEGYRWANTYEVMPFEEVSFNTLKQVANVICNLEREPLSSIVRVYKAVISTYAPDSEPYNPSSFTTINLNLPGAAGFSAELLPLNICVFVRKSAVTGRPGKIFYRGFLSEQNVSWGGDRFVITDQRQAQISQVMNAMLTELARLKVHLVLARGNPTPDNIRTVTDLVVTNRTSHKKLDNRYFDVKD